MAISDKLTYLNTTKSQLKDQINYGLPTEKQITNQTTFREYVGSIFEAFLEALRTPDTLFTNLPKTSGSGSNITLNGTAYAPMRITLNPTAISQDGTPTPTTPEDIHIITGNNSVVVEGKNLFNKNNPNILNANYSNGVIISNNSDRMLWIECLPNTTYAITRLPSTPYARFGMATTTTTPEIGTSYDNYSGTTTTDTSVTYTTNSTAKYLCVLFFNTSSTTYTLQEVLNSIQIEYGSTATTYTPYVSQTNPINLGEYEIGTIGNYSNEFVRSGGENLLPFTNQDFTVNNVRYYAQNGILYMNGTSTGETYSTNTNYKNNFSFTLKAGTYYFTRGTTNVATYLDNKNTGTHLVTNSGSFTLNEDTEVNLGFYIYNMSFNNTPFYIMLNKGTTALPYTPYEKGWYYKQGIGKVALDGSETIYDDWQNPNQTNTRQYYLKSSFLNDNYVPSTSSNITAMTNYFKCITHTIWNYDDERFALNDSTTYSVQFKISNTTAPTLADFKNWLSTHNTIIYYVLATPTYTKITGELAQELEQVYKGMLSYDGTTNISQVNNDLAFGLVASAITK